MNLKPANRKISHLAVIGAAFTTASMLLLSQIAPVKSGENYKEEIDRFTDVRAASYDATIGSECRLTKARKGELIACTFIHSTAGIRYNHPIIVFYKTSKGWDLHRYGSLGIVRVILTFFNGVTKKRWLPVTLPTEPIRGSEVMEAVTIKLGPIKDELKHLTKLEARYVSAEFLWINDRALTSRAMDFVEN